MLLLWWRATFSCSCTLLKKHAYLLLPCCAQSAQAVNATLFPTNQVSNTHSFLLRADRLASLSGKRH